MATHSSILAWRIPWTEEAEETLSLVVQRSGEWAVLVTSPRAQGEGRGQEAPLALGRTRGQTGF